MKNRNEKKRKSFFRCSVVLSDTGCWVHDISNRGDMFEQTTAGTSAFNNTVWHVRESGVFVQASILCMYYVVLKIKGPFTRNRLR